MPNAPSVIARRTIARMVSSSAAVGAPTASPFAYTRTVPAPTNEPTFSERPRRCMKSSHCPNPCGPVNRCREPARGGVGGGCEHLLIHRRGRVAFAEDRGGDALRDHRERAAVAGHEVLVRLRLDVDEPWCDGEPVCVDALRRRQRMRVRRVERCARSGRREPRRRPRTRRFRLPSTIRPFVITTSYGAPAGGAPVVTGDRHAATRARGKNGNDGCELAHDAHSRRYCSSTTNDTSLPE